MGSVPIFLALLAAALALYGSGLGHPLVFDDLHLTLYALKTHYADAASRLGLRWLSDASFAWIHALSGGALAAQRVVNVLLHALTAVALFGLLARLFEACGEKWRARRLALFGALWFTVHPAAVYAVAYLMQRSILLATLFSVLALRCFLEGLLRERASQATAWYAASAAAYLLAVSSKEHAVMVPALAAATALCLRGASLRVLPRGLGWAFAAFAAIGAAMVLGKRDILGMAYEPFVRDLDGVAVSWPLSAINQATLFWRYLLTWLAPWPGWMSIDVRTAFPASFASPAYVFGAAAWLAWGIAAGMLVAMRGRAGLAGLAMLWPWLLALTEIAAVRVQEPFVLYRSYLWMAGLPLALPALLPAGGLRWRAHAGAALLALFAFAAHERLATFSGPLALWDDVVSKTDPGAPFAERGWISRGLAHLAARRAEAARADFERALEINPRAPEALVGRGTVRLRAGRPEEALPDFDRAIALDPGYGTAWNKRCVAKAALGFERDALADCERAVALDANNDEAWINAGAVQRALGQRARAAESYARALDIRPGSGSAHYNFGVLLMETGGADKEIDRHFAAACVARVTEACAMLRRTK